MLNNTLSIISQKGIAYPNDELFSPSENYPEYPFQDKISELKNDIYCNFRLLLLQLKLDIKNFGTPEWNPFGEFIKPGYKVIIKPNWVRDINPIDGDISGLVTHPSILRAVLDYTIIALKSTGEIIFGDAPIQITDFESLKRKLNIDKLLNFYENNTKVKIRAKDFRQEIRRYNDKGVIIEKVLADNANSVKVNLRELSFLHPIQHQYKKFRVTNYDPRKMMSYHNQKDNIYVIERDILTADAIIQLPKLKTHRKAGITCCLKNSIGINCQKDSLVHHRKGSIATGGDAYPYFNIFKNINENLYELKEKTLNIRIQQICSTIIGINSGIIKKLELNRFFEGSWYGNNTLWRTILDITRILFYYDITSNELKTEPRNIFYVVDAIVGGEGEGPLQPNNKSLGFLAAGWNPVLIDSACASLIGFDFNKIIVLKKALENKFFNFGIEELHRSPIFFNNKEMHIDKLDAIAQFKPSRGWENHIEL